MTGPILKDIVTEKYLLVIRGVTARVNVLHLEQIFPAFIVRKRMFISRVYTAERILGWAYLISTLKGHSFGATEHHLTSITGQNTNQTTFTIKIVFIPWVSLNITSTNGTMSTAQTATDLPARKVNRCLC